jgi:hypothetical protein
LHLGCESSIENRQAQTIMSRRFLTTLSLTLLLLCTLSLGVFLGIPALANRRYGPPSPNLRPLDQFEFSTRLLWYGGMLTEPLDPNGTEQPFTIEPGEGIPSVAIRLEEVGLIRSAAAFRVYLVYTGLDTSVVYCGHRP